MQKKFGDQFLIPVPGEPVYFLNHPDLVREFLLEKPRSFERSYLDMKSFMGEGLITSDGDLWERQRKLMGEFFKPRSLENMIPLIREETAKSLDAFSSASKGPGLFRVEEELLRMTLNVVCRGLFSTQVDAEVRALGEDVDVFMKYIVHRLRSPVRLPFGTPSPRFFKFKSHLKHFNRLVEGWMNARWEDPHRQDLLDHLIRWGKEQHDVAAARRQIRDEVITMIIAGHETTTHALCWTLYLLAAHPHEVERVRTALRNLPDKELKTLKTCAPLMEVYQEALRLYPPVWYIERSAKEDVTLGGVAVSKGVRVAFSPYLIHRHPGFWERPEEFAPAFHFGEGKSPAAFSFVPFSTGGRSCIGKFMAEMEILIFLAEFIEKFDVETLPGITYGMDPLITLRPQKGMSLVLKALSST